MKKILTFTSLAVVACLTMVAPARGQQNKDIVDTAVAAGSFKTLAKALAAADLTVARAGASALGEFPAARLPAILAPLASVNQMDNAQALAKRGAAVIIEDKDLDAKLAGTLLELLAKPAQLQAMGEAMAGLARPQAAEAIASEVARLAQEG